MPSRSGPAACRRLIDTFRPLVSGLAAMTRPAVTYGPASCSLWTGMGRSRSRSTARMTLLLDGGPRAVHLPAGERRFDGALVAVEEARLVRAERLRDPGPGRYEAGHDGDRVAAAGRVRLGEVRRPAAVQSLRDGGEGEPEGDAGPGAGEPAGGFEPFDPAAKRRRRSRTARAPPRHSPRNTGRRFSTKEATPSRKSAEERSRP